MPTVPPLSAEQAQMSQASGTAGINPVNFLVAAAQMHNEGSLSAPTDPSGPKLGAKNPRANKRIRIIR